MHAKQLEDNAIPDFILGVVFLYKDQEWVPYDVAILVHHDTVEGGGIRLT